MKKLLLGLFVITLGLGLFACNEAEQEEALTLASEEQVFTLQALSSATLLDYDGIQELSYVPLSDVEATEEETLVDEEEVDELDRYLEMVESFLGNNNGLEVEILTSDLEAYAFKVSFTTVDLLGNESVYILYYNETVYEEEVEETTTTETPVTEEVTTEVSTTEVPTTEETTTDAVTSTPLAEQVRDFNFRDEDDQAVVYLLDGLMMRDGIEYLVEGKKVILEDGREIFRLRSYMDSENFVRVDYMVDEEDGLEKFFYQVVTDGTLISRSRVHILEEEGKLKVHMRLMDETQKATYMFGIIEEEDQTIIQVRYDILPTDGQRETGNIRIFVTLDSETGEAIYTYKILGSRNNDSQPPLKEIEKRHGRPDGVPGQQNRTDQNTRTNR